jgi:hypothetical protein
VSDEWVYVIYIEVAPENNEGEWSPPLGGAQEWKHMNGDTLEIRRGTRAINVAFDHTILA